ncbi:formylglycine-generating enzyme family protein [Yersinia pseudotuberculosis]
MNNKLTLLTLAVLLITACDNSLPPQTKKDNSEELEEYVQQIKANLIFVQGGDFQMGDFGEKYGKEHLSYDGNSDSKPLHKVELTGYSIEKFKVNNEEYKKYLSFNNVEGRVINRGPISKKYWEEKNSISETPAHVDWNEADNYCQWLAKVTKLPFSLPTEAQWEYAARNRGQFVIAPTNDGTIQIEDRKGLNVATEDDREAYARKVGTSLNTLSPMPGDARPPNPLGIYDMSGNGYEWIKDWYDPDYYQKSPLKDPQGPEEPVFKDPDGNFTKVLRAQDYSGPGRGLTVVRFHKDPLNNGRMPTDKTVRCVVNSPDPIK